MSNIFSLENIENFTDRLNIDELYEFKKVQDQNELALYNKVLNRVHIRIKATAKHSQICWFLVPEIILGVPKYNNANCIAFIINRLQDNGFHVRYVDPNLLWISWVHFVPSYVRSELKRKTGIVIDENGINTTTSSTSLTSASSSSSSSEMELTLTNRHKPAPKKYNDTSNYKPSGKLF
jgi:hypothetical protein